MGLLQMWRVGAGLLAVAGLPACLCDAATAASDAPEEEEMVCKRDSCGPFTEARAHHWPQARGHVGSYGRSNLTGPADLSSPWYGWFPRETRFHAVTLCGPLIDDQMNLYVTAPHAIYKLTTDGQRIWESPAINALADCPALMNGVLLATDMSGHISALELGSGRRLWSHQHTTSSNSGDTGYVTHHDGVVVFEADPGNERVVAVNATTGLKLWDFRPSTPVWNLMAMYPGDGTVLFQDIDAKTYRLGLHDGSLIWEAGGGHVPGATTWTDGGCMVDKDVGLIFSVSAKGNSLSHHPEVGGGVHAYRISDGGLAWEKHLLRPVFTWPVVGRLYGRNDTSVVISVGSNAYFPWLSCAEYTFSKVLGPFVLLLATWCLLSCCRGGCKWLLLRALVVASMMAAFVGFSTVAYAYNLLQENGLLIHMLPIHTFEAEIYAFDAHTGEKQWEYKLPPWPHVSAAGDAEGYFVRKRHYPQRGLCLPAAYSSPGIDASGTVYIGYHSGAVLGLRDVDGDGVVSGAGEVLSYDAQAAFLHSGPAFAPGLMAITSCDTMHVWRT